VTITPTGGRRSRACSITTTAGHLIVDDDGEYVLRPRKQVPRGTVPHFHGLRHTAESEAIAAGDGAEEVSWQLGHKNSNVTRSVYVQEIKK